MKRLIEFTTEDSDIIIVESYDSVSEGGRVQVGSVTDIAEKAQKTFESAIEKIRPAASILISKLKDMSQSPNEVRVEFGIKLSAQAGAIITSAESEATFKITLSWKNSKP
jgi:hypothetical protein